MEDNKMYDEIRQVREGMIRVEEAIKAMQGSTSLELKLITEKIEQERILRRSLEVRIASIEDDRKFKIRTAISEVIKYSIIAFGILIAAIKL